MRALVQRIIRSRLCVDGNEVSSCGKGLIVYFGVKKGDTEKELDFVVNKVVNLRIFEDENGKMNLSVKDVGGEIMAVSQFTLYGDTKKGFRPSFTEAEEPIKASKIYDEFCDRLEKEGIKVARGIFGADMKIEYINDGPVTIYVEKENV